MKPNGWKLFHLWPTVLSETQNYPIPICPFWAKIWNLEPYHLLDIITKEKPAKFQTKRTAGSKVLRLCNFCAPKRVKTRKGPKSVPYLNFPVFQVEIPRNHGHRPNFKRNRFKFLHLELTELSVSNCPTSQTPIFGGKLEIRTMAVRRYQAGSRACQISNLTNTRSHCYRAPYFWSQKWGNAQNPLCHVHIPILLGAFVPVGDPTKSWKFGPNWPGQSDVRACRNLGPKISTGPKKRIRA